MADADTEGVKERAKEKQRNKRKELLVCQVSFRIDLVWRKIYLYVKCVESLDINNLDLYSHFCLLKD